MYALRLDENGRVLEVMNPARKTEDTPLVESYPLGFLYDYRYCDGEWIYDPAPRLKNENNMFDVMDSLVGAARNRLQGAEQLRKALQMFAGNLDDDRAMEVAAVFDPWEAGKAYKGGDIFAHGLNNVGDPQLYRVNEGKDHVSQADWAPGTEGGATLYTAFGLDDSGYAIWSQPTGAHDAYDEGDVVSHEGTLYVSGINGNTTVPGTDERYWSVYAP